MRLSKSVPALFIISASLWGADPFVGTWKLNIEKSNFGSGPKAMSGSTTYEANGDGYMYTSETVFGENQVARLRVRSHVPSSAHDRARRTRSRSRARHRNGRADRRDR